MILSARISGEDSRVLEAWVVACIQHSTIHCLVAKAAKAGMILWRHQGRDMILWVQEMARATCEVVHGFLAEVAQEGRQTLLAASATDSSSLGAVNQIKID
jgi:hypothetical protein